MTLARLTPVPWQVHFDSKLFEFRTRYRIWLLSLDTDADHLGPLGRMTTKKCKMTEYAKSLNTTSRLPSPSSVVSGARHDTPP